MKTIIYYFTGTGNSLAAARKIAAGLGDCELVPIALLKEFHGEICHRDERIGIVCPVYHAGLPCIVAGFAERLAIFYAPYVFAVVTPGRMGALAIHQLNGILYRKNGRHLDAAWIVRMPGNYPPVIQVPSGCEQQELLKAADAQLAEIARMIDNGTTCPPVFPPFSLVIMGLAGSLSNRSVCTSDRNFSVADSCTACRICEQVCPVDNIVMIQDRPSWLHHCESCGACLNFCPEEAIRRDIIRGISGSGRYHHPDVTPADMIIHKTDPPRGADCETYGHTNPEKH